MLKKSILVKPLHDLAEQALRKLLEQVHAIELKHIEHEPEGDGRGADLVAHVEAQGRSHALVCEVKSSGQPRHVRMGLLELRDYLGRHAPDATPVLIAPYLSPQAQALCREQGAGFLDLEGNTRLQFGSVFIERQVAGRPAADRRQLKSLFTPKSAQVQRVLLRNPGRPWRVTELADAAHVSLGHVSNVRAGLIDREWAKVADGGLVLSAPDALLDGWRDAYEPPAGKRLGFYTTLHGSALDDVARQTLGAPGTAGHAAFASFSAAQWLAPYGRTGAQYFYADEIGAERLQTELKLSAATKGENVVVTVLKDPGLLRDTVEPAPGAICTSLVQTYLDLCAAGERGREAAEHLRREKLAWPK